MACHAPTTWATESLSNSVAEFEYLRLNSKGSSWSGYKSGMSDGKGVAWQPRSTRHMQAQILDVLRTWQSDLRLSQSQWERKRRGEKSGSDSGRDLNPRQIACHALTNWATRQLSGWVRVLKTEIYLKLKVYMPRVYKTAINCSS